MNKGSWKGRGVDGLGDWVMGTEGCTWRDEHWVLSYMLANQTPIKTYTHKKGGDNFVQIYLFALIYWYTLVIVVSTVSLVYFIHTQKLILKYLFSP